MMKLWIYENHIRELRSEELFEGRSSQLYTQLMQLRKESLTPLIKTFSPIIKLITFLFRFCDLFSNAKFSTAFRSHGNIISSKIFDNVQKHWEQHHKSYSLRRKWPIKTAQRDADYHIQWGFVCWYVFLFMQNNPATFVSPNETKRTSSKEVTQCNPTAIHEKWVLNLLPKKICQCWW